MDKNFVGVQMDSHLTNIQKETKAALEQFKESGLKIDADFIKYFLRLSIERYTIYDFIFLCLKIIFSDVNLYLNCNNQ